MKKSNFSSRLKHSWNVFFNKEPPKEEEDDFFYTEYSTSSYRPNRRYFSYGGEKTIITSIINRMSIDAASITIMHARTDENEQFLNAIDSGLNNCLNNSANIDQSGRSFLQDIVMSMLDEGVVAIVPVDTSVDPRKTNSYDILSMRTGKILEWYPQHVKISVYNELSGSRENVILPKDSVAIVENPWYSVMNEANSVGKRLIRKLNLLDVIDEQTGSGKLDMIIQLPYVIKSEARRQQAENRRKDIEDQLVNSKYGIAYTDGTEKIVQLNRSVENTLMTQIEYLTDMLYSQLGITQEIMNGTASEAVMLNYFNRTIEPIVSAIVDEMKRKFLSKTAISQKQSIIAFRDPFKLVPVSELAEIADKMTRNEIMSSNEIRQVIGKKPVNAAEADELRNKNLNRPSTESAGNIPTTASEDEIKMEKEQRKDDEGEV